MLGEPTSDQDRLNFHRERKIDFINIDFEFSILDWERWIWE